MVDELRLGQNEVAFVDTATNIAIVILIWGSIEVRNANDNVLAVLNEGSEAYVIPANTGKYKIVGLSQANACKIVRVFIL